MKDVMELYKAVSYDLPDSILTWHLFGAGMENFGRDKKPVRMAMPTYSPDELLVRVDAVSICYSDIKVIKLGNKHPRVIGRDLSRDPVTLGHEAAVTVVGVGEHRAADFKIGDRFTVQADVFYSGQSTAFGYVLPGAQTQYQVIKKEMLDGDEGCYLIPMAAETGYAEAALAEPWACVIASYRIKIRASIRPGGLLWVVGSRSGDSDYSLDFDADPRLIVATDLKWPVLDQLKFWREAGRFELVESPPFQSGEIESFVEDYGGFDDIIVLSSNADLIEKVAQFLGKNGILNIVSQKPIARPVQVDIGKIHYWGHGYVGTSGRHLRAAYEPVRVMSELKPGGVAWFIGAGGPMGQMHVQRAVGLPDGPRKVLATDIDSSRLESLKERSAPIAARSGTELIFVNPTSMSKSEFGDLLQELTEGKGFDDIVMLAPVTALIEEAIPYLGDGGLLNIFAGFPIGTRASLDLNAVVDRRVRFVGSSGSKLSDMRDTLHATESGQLSTNTSVAAIGGIEASWDGMVAAEEGRYPGKIVIYPQITGLELTALPDLKDRLPNVYAKLTDGVFWSREAEAELLRTMLKL